MTTLTRPEAWLLLALAWSVLVGFGLAVALHGWLDRRRATRRLAAAEAAFWVSLREFVEAAREDIAADGARPADGRGAVMTAPTCDNYPPPLTCLTAPSTVTGRCDDCADAADDAEFERLHKREQEAGAGL